MQKNKTLQRISKILIILCICVLPLFSAIFMQAKTAVRLNKSSLVITKNETFNLKLKNAKKVKFSSADKKIATVSAKGKITAISPGKTKITAKYQKKKYTCKVSVIALSSQQKNLNVGQKITLKIKGTTNKTKWKTQNANIATVTQKGTVTAISPGKTTITATVSNKTLKCKITVKSTSTLPVTPSPAPTLLTTATPTTTDTTIPNITTIPAPTQTPNTDNDVFSVSFIDVGQADCILIQDNGCNVLIDTGKEADNDTIIQYLENKGIKKLDYVFLTHYHEDHIGSFKYLPARFSIGTVYIRPNVNNVTSKIYEETIESIEYYNLTVKESILGETITFGKSSAQVIGPVNAENYDDENANSIVLLLTYKDKRFFLGGDTTQEMETEIMTYAASNNISLKDIDVYKVSHHGSAYSSSYAFVREITEKTTENSKSHAIISVGEGNSYFHPHDATLNRLEQAGMDIHCTKDYGTITCTVNGNELILSFEKGNGNSTTEPTLTPTPAIEPTISPVITYIGNKNSLKVHVPTCNSLPLEKNRVYFSSLEEAIASGYSECKNCIK